MQKVVRSSLLTSAQCNRAAPPSYFPRSKPASRSITKIWADAGYRAGAGAAALAIYLEIVTKTPDQIGFAVQPRRWIVERSLARISRHRRTVRDYERLPQHHAATVRFSAMTIIMTRGLARYTT